MMIVFTVPLIRQLPNSCWLYSCCVASSTTKEGFQQQIEVYKDRLKSNGYSSEAIDHMIEHGANVESKEKLFADMGLKEKFVLDDLIQEGEINHCEIYAYIKNILKLYGPLILERPALGSGSLHHIPLIGAVMAKNSASGKEELFLIFLQTMSGKIEAMPLLDLVAMRQVYQSSSLQHVEEIVEDYADLDGNIEQAEPDEMKNTEKSAKAKNFIFYAVPQTKVPTPYSKSETVDFANSITNQKLGGVSLRNDIVAAGYDTLIVSSSKLMWKSEQIFIGQKPVRTMDKQEVNEDKKNCRLM